MINWRLRMLRHTAPPAATCILARPLPVIRRWALCGCSTRQSSEHHGNLCGVERAGAVVCWGRAPGPAAIFTHPRSTLITCRRLWRGARRRSLRLGAQAHWRRLRPGSGPTAAGSWPGREGRQEAASSTDRALRRARTSGESVQGRLLLPSLPSCEADKGMAPARLALTDVCLPCNRACQAGIEEAAPAFLPSVAPQRQLQQVCLPCCEQHASVGVFACGPRRTFIVYGIRIAAARRGCLPLLAAHSSGNTNTTCMLPCLLGRRREYVVQVLLKVRRQLATFSK
jgi:hypothetical protein